VVAVIIKRCTAPSNRPRPAHRCQVSKAAVQHQDPRQPIQVFRGLTIICAAFALRREAASAGDRIALAGPIPYTTRRHDFRVHERGRTTARSPRWCPRPMTAGGHNRMTQPEPESVAARIPMLAARAGVRRATDLSGKPEVVASTAPLGAKWPRRRKVLRSIDTASHILWESVLSCRNRGPQSQRFTRSGSSCISRIHRRAKGACGCQWPGATSRHQQITPESFLKALA